MYHNVTASTSMRKFVTNGVGLVLQREVDFPESTELVDCWRVVSRVNNNGWILVQVFE